MSIDIQQYDTDEKQYSLTGLVAEVALAVLADMQL
jgi:hypothetical protein